MSFWVPLIDGDMYAYRAAASVETAIDWGDGDKPEPTTNIPEACRRVDGMIGRMLDRFDGWDTYHLYLSCPDHNFRKDILPSYKENRNTKAQPLARKAVEQHLRDKWGAVHQYGLEADDLMGIMATDPGEGDTVIVSIDKDMRTIPGHYWNPYPYQKDAEDPVLISPLEATRFWMYQTLVGDTCDGFKGCPGIGPVKADGWLRDAQTPDEMWTCVVNAFELKGFTEADALVQARVARILHHNDFNHETKEPILWTPPA